MIDWPGKWNYKPIFIGNASETIKKDYECAKKKELFGVSRMRINEGYYLIFDRLVLVANQILVDQGFAPIEVSREQLILLDAQEFERKIARGEDIAAKYSAGYVYFVDRACKITLYHNLTHEIAHLFSFLGITLYIEENKRVWCHGYCRTEEGNSLFIGLDEAATELFAYLIRLKILNDSSLLLSSEAEELCERFIYREQIKVVKNLLQQFPDFEEVKNLLLKSYIDGSDDFFLEVEKYSPGGRDLLKILGR